MNPSHSMLRAAVIGKDGRTTAVTEALNASRRVAGPVPCLSAWKGLSTDDAIAEVLRAAEAFKPDFVFVGPEEPLAADMVGKLWSLLHIPSIGPTKALAQIESSKSFTRELLSKHRIPGNPRFRVFDRFDGELVSFLEELGDFVVKPDGLTGGKGVKVSGIHIKSVDEAAAYCETLLQKQPAKVVIEERLDGEEFSLQSFTDGTSVVDMPLVQDHKRAFEGDIGPNTGGMGSYSCADHSLPFLQREHVAEASEINRLVLKALQRETGQQYKGVLYGGFIATKDGVRLIEYNARFGDPEALNVVPLLRTELADLADVFWAIVEGTLAQCPVQFDRLATVCKYIVPQGYPEHPVTGQEVGLDRLSAAKSSMLRIYPAAIERREDGWYLTGSRAIGIVGIGKDVEEAYRIAEDAACRVEGPVFHRSDIGSAQLIQARVEHMKAVSPVSA